MEDYHVDRPGVEVGRPMKLTGTNNPIGLIVSQQNSFDDDLRKVISDNVFFILVQADALARLELGFAILLSPWLSRWLCRRFPTRSHPELGR